MKGNKVYTLVGILDYDGFPSIDRERWEIKSWVNNFREMNKEIDGKENTG